MGLAIVEVESDRGVPLDFDGLQLAQFKHDETYHREIARLSTQDRLKHMALHFAKYAGNLAEADEDNDALEKAVTDTFIIAVSTANILNLRLSDALPHLLGSESVTAAPFARTLAIHAGRMAAACEKLDHLEDFSFRSVIRESALALVRAAVTEARRRRWDIRSLSVSRLAGVKQKMIFHGKV
jgi:hypothetical protein